MIIFSLIKNNMAHSDNYEASVEQSFDIEPTVGRVKTTKFRNIKSLPRWKHLGKRRSDYEDHADTCALMGDEPFPKHSQGHVSAAKLKGSPEYREKVNKMAERRNRVRHHEPDVLTTNVRWCGCSMDADATEKTLCCSCAEYGAPDMKRIPRNKWGSQYASKWNHSVKKRKVRPHDKPCAPPFTTVVPLWDFANDNVCEPVVFPQYTNDITLIYNDYFVNAFYDFYV